MTASEIIALDVGAVRTGIARASSAARLAEALKTVQTEEVVEEIRRLATNDEVSKVVVGLPRNMGGEETAQTDWVRHFVEDAKTELPQLEFFFQDESLTTVTAESKGKKVTDPDAEAARIILQDFLDSEGKS